VPPRCRPGAAGPDAVRWAEAWPMRSPACSTKQAPGASFECGRQRGRRPGCRHRAVSRPLKKMIRTIMCTTEFLMALSFDSVNDYRTIPVGIALFGSQFVVPYGTIFAASVVAVVPVGILAFMFRRSVVSGLTAGAMKG
jgi:hypothetical protein